MEDFDKFCLWIAVSNAIGPYSPDGQGMGGFLMDGQPPHMAMRTHAGWPSGKKNLWSVNKLVFC